MVDADLILTGRGWSRPNGPRRGARQGGGPPAWVVGAVTWSPGTRHSSFTCGGHGRTGRTGTSPPRPASPRSRACAAQPSDRVGFRSGAALFRGHEVDGPILLVGDETALPALAAIVDSHPDLLNRTTIHLEVADEAVLTAYTFGEAVTHVHARTDGTPGSAVLPALRAAHLDGLSYAWLCGESGMVTAGRRHLVRECGIDRRKVLFSGYWKLGQERG